MCVCVYEYWYVVVIVRVRLVVVVAYWYVLLRWRHRRVSWGTLGEERKVRRRRGAQCHTVRCRCTIGEKAREEVVNTDSVV